MRMAIYITALLSLCFAPGCASEQPKNKYVETPAVLYEDLRGHTAAVMIWADWRTRNEYSQIQLDLGKRLTAKLEDHLRPKKEGEKPKGPPTQFTLPASVVRYQREHPEVMSEPIAQVAPHLQAERVIFVELEEFTVHNPQAIMVLRGSAKATLRVLEVSGGVAKLEFEESGISAHYPPDNAEGVIASDKINERTIYDGVLDLLSEKFAARFKFEK